MLYGVLSVTSGPADRSAAAEETGRASSRHVPFFAETVARAVLLVILRFLMGEARPVVKKRRAALSKDDASLDRR